MKASGVYAEIYAKLASEQSMFPSLPSETLRLRKMLNDPNCRIAPAAKALRANPGLSAFLLKTANSVRYLTRSPARDLESAIRRIGLPGAAQLTTSFAVRSVYQAPTPALRKLLEQAYHTATRISVMSYFLAQHVRGFEPNTAMLGGLLQDIALPLSLKVLYERKDIFDDADKLTAAIDELCPLVGVLILKKWEFDDDLIETARSRKQWMRDPAPEPDLADLVLIARYHAILGTPEFRQCPPLDTMPAFRKLPLNEITPEKSLKLLSDSQQELNTLSQMLH